MKGMTFGEKRRDDRLAVASVGVSVYSRVSRWLSAICPHGWLHVLIPILPLIHPLTLTHSLSNMRSSVAAERGDDWQCC